MGADINTPLDIDSFLNTDKITPTFPSIPKEVREDLNQTVSSNIEKEKSSFLNFDVTGGKFGILNINGINSDLKLEDIPETIPSNKDINPNSEKYSKVGKLRLAFKGSFKELEIPYSMIRPNENKLEVTFYNINKKGQVKEHKVIFIQKQSGIEEYRIDFEDFNGKLLGTDDLTLEINIDWK